MTPAPTPIRLGFIPLLDAAIPIVAADRGFAAREGIDLALVRETSWANIRDRLAIGHFEAAHLLAPMPVAAALGLTPLDVPLIAPMALGLGGNAVTVSAALWAAMRAAKPDVIANDPVSVGAALKAALAARGVGRRLAFAVVHPYSAHNYELRYWLAACGIRPDADLDLAILPPPLMPDALAAGTIDGFCVGEPWNSNAARRSGGCIVLTKPAIWRAGPEKVLGIRADWAERHPDALAALLRAMLAAARWCAEAANAGELVSLLARPDRLNLPEDDIAAPLSGRMRLADGGHHHPGDFIGGTAPEDGGTNLPLRGAALWFLSQMARWGQTTLTPDAIARAAASYRPDLFLPVADAASAGRPLPPLRPLAGFFDGEVFDPASIEAYLARQRTRDSA